MLAALSITAAVLAGAAVPAAPLRDAATLAPVADAALVRPWAYVLLSPFCALADAVSILSVRQHVALVAAALALHVLRRVWRRRPRLRAPVRLRAALRETTLALAALAAVVSFYAVVTLVPRPMAALGLADADVVRVDFHAHTSASWDARPGTLVESVRAWQRAAGFDAAYVTDHSTWRGAGDAARGNPRRAGAGTVLLPGIEIVDYTAFHYNILGDSFPQCAASSERRAKHAFERCVLASARATAGRDRVIAITIPGDVRALPARRQLTARYARAIEIVDGSPRGLEQERRDRAEILRIAERLDLALLAGSDNHGWGRAAPAWTLLRIPGWRALSPAASRRRSRWPGRSAP